MDSTHPLDIAISDIKVIVLPDTAGGLDLDWSDFGHNRIQILSVGFLLQTFTPAGARYIAVAGNDGTNNFQVSPSSYAQNALVSIFHDFSVEGTFLAYPPAITLNYARLPPDFFLHEGDHLITISSFLGIADIFRGATIRYKVWCNH